MDIFNFDAIPAAKRTKAKENILAIEPNRLTMNDPAWVDPGDGSPPDQIPKYTDLEWLNELAWRYFETLNLRGAERLAKQATLPVDDIRTV